jgi:hypothetical protein
MSSLFPVVARNRICRAFGMRQLNFSSDAYSHVVLRRLARCKALADQRNDAGVIVNDRPPRWIAFEVLRRLDLTTGGRYQQSIVVKNCTP